MFSRRQFCSALLPTVAAQAAEIPIQPGSCGSSTTVDGFESYCFTDSKGIKRQLYVAGSKGAPPVLVLHELPGLTKDDLRFARDLAAEGFRSVVPLMFGQPFDDRFVHFYFEVCGQKRFGCKIASQTSPEVEWMRELVRAIRGTWPDGRGVGAVGMCLTGAFPLALMCEPAVVAAVLCQPTAPFSFWSWLGLSRSGRKELGMSPGDLARVRERKEPILGIRFTGDPLCPTERFDRLTNELKNRLFRLDLREKHQHSTLGKDRCPAAFDETKAYLRHQLIGPSEEPRWKWPQRSVHNVTGQQHAQACNAATPAHHSAAR